MKNNIIISIVTLALVTGIISCKKGSFLDDQTTSAITEAVTFSDSTNTMAFLARIYEDIGFAFNKTRWEGGANTNQGTDDTEYNLNNPVRAAVSLATGGFSAVNLYPNNSGSGNGTIYQLPWSNIRRVNLLLSHLPTTPLSPALQLRIKGEARFMRAYFYAYLIMNFGGVPIIGDKVYGNDDVISLPRNTFADCVTYVTKELDTAATLLPNINDPIKINGNSPAAAGYDPGIDYGRVTKGSCMGIKSRLLLYAASPLSNGGQISSATAAQKPLIGYPAYDASRWQIAADAALAVMNLAGSPYSLYTEATPTNVHGNDSTPGWGFQQTFLNRVTPATGGQYHQEYLLVVNRPPNNEWEVQDNPPSRSGNGNRINPSLPVINMFPMRNGKPITDPTSGYNPNNPYFNRDPRFDYSIIYNGSTYYSTTTNKRDTVWTYTGPNTPTSPNGSTAVGQTTDAYVTGTFTGFYSRKMCDPNVTGRYSTTNRCWGLMRYAEILLNYAEAINEAGQPALAYAPIILLRQRAGISPGTDNLYGLPAGMTQDQMRTIVRTERHIELLFEGDFKWNDMCRWKIATTIINANGGAVQGIQIIRTNSSFPRTFTYNVVNSTRPLAHFFAEPEYLFPYPLSEIQKVPLLVQNPGW